MTYLVSVIVWLATLGLFIFLHGCGRYAVARACRIRIERVRIGVAPVVVARTSARTGTTFQLSAIPFGGFVKIRGLNAGGDVDPEDRHAYRNRPAWAQLVTIVAGPVTNYLSVATLAMALYTCHGVESRSGWYGVGEVIKGYDAYGKLEPGDRITKVNGQPLFVDSHPNLTERINETKDAPVTLTVERGGKPVDIAIKPKLDKNAAGQPGWMIGVRLRLGYQDVAVGVSLFDAGRRALIYPVEQTKMIGHILYVILFGSEKADPGGPIRMANEYQPFTPGIVTAIQLLLVVWVNFSLVNLLPIPPLDGGRLIFLVYELVTRRRINPKIETMVSRAGIAALCVVVLVTLYLDIRRVFT
jgi:regulator of sigma E protease